MIGFIRPVEADDLSVTPFNELPHVRAEPPVRVATVDEAQASSSLPRYDDVAHNRAARAHTAPARAPRIPVERRSRLTGRLTNRRRETFTFLGVCGYYRKFISQFATVAAPLTALLTKEAQFTWTDAQDRAFMRLRDALITPQCSRYPT